jgi:RNA polymerase sigma-70 factor (ECF subfamily)
MVGLARPILHNDDLAQDAAQLALWRACLNLDRYDGSRPFEPWILKIVCNVALDMVRRRQARPGTDGGEMMDDLADDGPLVAEQAASNEEVNALLECEEGLGERSRKVVALFKTGSSLSKIGQALSRPKNTVQSWLNKALEQLRRCMEGKGFE